MGNNKIMNAELMASIHRVRRTKYVGRPTEYSCGIKDEITNQRRQQNLAAARCLDANLNLLGLYKIPWDLVLHLIPKDEFNSDEIYPAWRDMDIELVEDEGGNWSYYPNGIC